MFLRRLSTRVYANGGWSGPDGLRLQRLLRHFVWNFVGRGKWRPAAKPLKAPHRGDGGRFFCIGQRDRIDQIQRVAANQVVRYALLILWRFVLFHQVTLDCCDVHVLIVHLDCGSCVELSRPTAHKENPPTKIEDRPLLFHALRNKERAVGEGLSNVVAEINLHGAKGVGTHGDEAAAIIMKKGQRIGRALRIR